MNNTTIFLLGALTMYLVSCAVASILDLLGIAYIDSFAEPYFYLPLLIIVSPYYFLIKRLPKMIHDAKILKRYGFGIIGKYEQFDDADIETLEKIKREIYNSGIKRYCDDLIWKKEEEVDHE